MYTKRDAYVAALTVAWFLATMASAAWVGGADAGVVGGLVWAWFTYAVVVTAPVVAVVLVLKWAKR